MGDNIIKIKRLVKSWEPNPNNGIMVRNLEQKLREFINSYSANTSIEMSNQFNQNTTTLIGIKQTIGKVIGFDDRWFTVRLNEFGKELFKNGIYDYSIAVNISYNLLTPYKCDSVNKFVLYKK